MPQPGARAATPGRQVEARRQPTGALAAALALSLALLAGCASTPEPWAPPAEAVRYDYPIDNPWLATIAGTPQAAQADLPEPDAWERRTVNPFPARQTPVGFWYYKGLTYSLITQRHRAPLVFVIGATGADDRAPLMTTLGKVLHAAGLHVVLLPSPTHPNFIVTASATHVPGNPDQDAADLYRVMRLVRGEAGERIDISDFYLTGYSLGGWHAAFIAKLDEEEQAFGFKRVLLLDPPVSLYRSVRTIDQLLIQNIPGGVDGLGRFLDDAVTQLLAAYQTTDALDFEDEDLALALYTELDPADDQLAAVIGLSFRLAAASMIFTSDVMSRAGYIYPRNKPFLSTTPLGSYLAVSLRTSLIDYFRDVYAPFYSPRHPELSREDFIERSDLASIGDYLSTTEKIGVFANQDDVVLAPGDIEELRRLFGNRARIYPNGGHLGNLDHRAVVADIVDFFRK
jgi:predicted alpha/beta-fold hydrolase